MQEHFPRLSRPQQRGLARWVTGALLADSANQPSVVSALATLGEAAPTTLADPWDTWIHHPAFQDRDPLPDAETSPSPLACGAALLGWVLDRWTGGPLLLGLDAALRRDDVVLLRRSVLYRGTSSPVSWVIVPAKQPGAWMPHLQTPAAVAAAVNREVAIILDAKAPVRQQRPDTLLPEVQLPDADGVQTTYQLFLPGVYVQ